MPMKIRIEGHYFDDRGVPPTKCKRGPKTHHFQGRMRLVVRVPQDGPQLESISITEGPFREVKLHQIWAIQGSLRSKYF